MNKQQIILNNFENLAFLQRETFISTIKHDLKVPVIAQIRALELIIGEKMGVLNQFQKEILNLTLDSCRSIYSLLSEILYACKYENQNVILEFENINIITIIEKYFSKASDCLSAKNLNVEIKNESYFPSICADKHQLEKAFEYIANSCISYASQNSKIICKITDSDELIQITLTFVTGNDRNFDNIFEGLSNHKMDKVGNSLGLYLAKQIINAHRGTVDIIEDIGLKKYVINLPLNIVNNVQ